MYIQLKTLSFHVMYEKKTYKKLQRRLCLCYLACGCSLALSSHLQTQTNICNSLHPLFIVGCTFFAAYFVGLNIQHDKQHTIVVLHNSWRHGVQLHLKQNCKKLQKKIHFLQRYYYNYRKSAIFFTESDASQTMIIIR